MPRLSFVNHRIILAIVGALVGGAACSLSSLSPSQQRALDASKCYHAALEPVVGELTEKFLEAALAGGDLVKMLIVHGVRIEDVAKAAGAFEQCAVNAASPTEAADLEPSTSVNL